MALALAALSVAACDSPPASSASWDYQDVEYQLAVLDEAPLTDEVIARYAAALDIARDVCRQDRRAMGDLAAAARRMMAEQGAAVSVFEVLTAIPGAVPPGMRPFDCAELPVTMTAVMTGAGPTTSATVATTSTTSTTVVVEEYRGQTLDGATFVLRSDDGTRFVAGVPKDIDDIDRLAAAGDCDSLRDRARTWARLAGLGDEGRAASVYAQHAANAFEWIRCRGDALGKG